jgi:HlyD family secretion protein
VQNTGYIETRFAQAQDDSSLIGGGIMKSRLKRVIPVLFALVLIFGAYWWWKERPAGTGGDNSASGTIEATEVSVASEASGRVVAVNAAEGDAVQAGQELVTFDTALLHAQRNQAEANLAAVKGTQAAAEANTSAAQANLDQLMAGARPQEIVAEQQAVVAAQGRVSSAQGQMAQTRGALQAAAAQRDQAVARFAQLKQGARAEQITAAAVALEQAEAAVRVAQANYDQIASRGDAGRLPQALALQQATLQMEAAKSNYEGLLKGATTPELDQARAGINQAVAGIVQASAAVSQTEAALVTAQAGLAAERARLELMQAGARPEQIEAAKAQVAAAQAQAEAARGQVAAAQAALNVIDEQLARMTIRAPINGVVLSRAIEPGEVALAGGALLALGDLQHPTVTVYVPEDRYGTIQIGQPTQVTVDSFPGRVFSGTVRRIADRGEFTPRNIQTPAGRRTVVYAIKIAVENPSGELKPGMPADVAFGDVAFGK